MSDDYYPGWWDRNGDGHVDGWERTQGVLEMMYMQDQMDSSDSNGDFDSADSDDSDIRTGPNISYHYTPNRTTKENSPEKPKTDTSDVDAASVIIGFILMFVLGVGGGIAVLFSGRIVLAVITLYAGVWFGCNMMQGKFK